MISVVEFEKYIANASIFSIIIRELRYRKKPYPIILFEVDKSLKVGFYYTILFFGLTVYLWIEGGGEFLLNVKEII